MRKTLILALLVVVALIIDGAMAYDIFDLPSESRDFWLVFGLSITIALVLYIAGASKPRDKENTPK